MSEHLVVIKAEVIDGFISYNHDESVVLAETNNGEVFTAVLHEESGEYYAKDNQGRSFSVAYVGFPGEIYPEEGMRLIDEP